ncbi:hypothetical protein FXN63_07345 [Pigmentiphaga aceris]|uniref:Uncharacterized protein n=1 Tax=Pigmentiphaga aceris TaxID=1940612 RepID=A0A5C0AU60_9BURK|nr:hypothetical protein [Pigmentiphaga aceris]QEI05675.1 hypothetical protein FXN63_07345 [Pigmentiphaga aceris]
MLSAQQASAIVLDLHKGFLRDGQPERFVIYYCELSSNGDYWVIRCNSEDCIVHGKTEYCYVGVNAHLVEVKTGRLETVVSSMSIEEYLQDKGDLEAAASKSYVLEPSFSKESKAEVINLRQKLASSYTDTFALLLGAGRHWLTGKRRHLEHAQRLLAIEGIASEIGLQSNPKDAITVGPETWHIDAVLRAIHKRQINLRESDR